MSTMLPYQLEGNGYPLLLIHGWGVTYSVWHKLVPLLAPHFRLIIVELSGIDEVYEVVPDMSYYPACAEALEELRVTLGIEQWAIMAYSTGTRVGEAYLQRYPQRVARAVFLCPIYLRKPWKMIIQVMQRIDAKRSEVGNWIISGWRLYWLLLWFGFNLHQRDYANNWLSEIQLHPLASLKRIILELPGTGRAPFILPTSPLVPTLFVWGLRDTLAALPPNPRPNDVFIYASHGAPVLTPHSVAEVVLPFLNEEVILQNIYLRTRQTRKVVSHST
jgi:pimeloyl-ACP methyl ester carboxylesterase